MTKCSWFHFPRRSWLANLTVLFEQIIEVLDPEPHSGALNMALDEALLQRTVLPTLRIYGWRAPALSLGYFSRFADAQRAAAGREMVRRWTGGGLVEHGDDVTYTLIVPRGAAFLRHTPLESYRLIHGQIAQWLMAGGIAAHVAANSANEKSGACFASHVRYDIVAGGAKLAGAAQRRTRWGLLHQGVAIAGHRASIRGQRRQRAGGIVRRDGFSECKCADLIQAVQQIAEESMGQRDRAQQKF